MPQLSVETTLEPIQHERSACPANTCLCHPQHATLHGAGAVVVKEVKPYALVVGNPSRQIGWISEFGHRLTFDETGIAVCPESGEKYELKNNRVNKIT